MKAVYNIVGILVITFSGLLMSCNSSTKMHASKQPVQKVKADTTETVDGKNIRPDTIKKIQTETLGSLPPSKIEDQFSAEHSLATNVTWAKETTPINSNESSNSNYKAVYTENGKKNWITYAATGDIIEERHEILKDQLPQNIYNSIKQKYPDTEIVSVSTYKHLKHDGSYAVSVKPISDTDSKEMELILRENGTVVE